ncbi:MAG: signal peptide peptidase SppA [Syntrophales bacterium]
MGKPWRTLKSWTHEAAEMISDAKYAIRQIDEFSDDDSIRAVVIRIESPGGGVVPSQEIYQAIKMLKRKKHVVASMGSVAASGGYLIACGAERIVANPGTITGSISVIMHFANAQELLKKIGLKASSIQSGKYKDIGSPVKEMTPEERKLLQSVVDDTHEQFLSDVATSRNIPKEKLRSIADGRIFTGRQAKYAGLVDELGDQRYAVRLASKMAGLEGEPELVYPKAPRNTVWDYLLQGLKTALAKQVNEAESNSPALSYLSVHGS